LVVVISMASPSFPAIYHIPPQKARADEPSGESMSLLNGYPEARTALGKAKGISAAANYSLFTIHSSLNPCP
jgi:hypothetical protein